VTNTAETHALVQREKGKKQMIQRRLLPAYLFLIIISFLSVFPLLWMISAATNTSLDVARGKIMFGTYAMQNFKNLIAESGRCHGQLLPVCDRADRNLHVRLLSCRIWF